jgi:hypothetical protein
MQFELLPLPTPSFTFTQMLYFAITSRVVLGFIHFPTQWIQRFLSSEIKHPTHEADHLHPCSAKLIYFHVVVLT